LVVLILSTLIKSTLEFLFLFQSFHDENSVLILFSHTQILTSNAEEIGVQKV